MVNNHGSRKNKSLIIPDVGKITYDHFVSNTLMLRNRMKSIVENYIAIGEELKFIKENKIYKLGDYKSFIDYCKTEFGLSKNQSYNFINVYERFSDEKYKNYNYSSLVEMLSLPDEKLKEVSPGSTVKEIRKIKKEIKSKDSIISEVKQTQSSVEFNYRDLTIDSKNVICYSVWKAIDEVLDKKEKPYSVAKELVEYYLKTYLISGKSLEDKLKEYPIP